MRIKNVRGIVWDLDGTLINSFGIFEQIIAEVINESGHPKPTRSNMLKEYHGSLEDTLQRILNIKSQEELDRTALLFLNKQEKHYSGSLEKHLYQDAMKLAQQATQQEIHQLLVTNRAHLGRGVASPKHIISSTILANYISEVYSGDEVQYRKPDKRSMGNWMERYNLLPSEVIVIGDQFVDAQLALNIGARAILIKRNEEIPHLDKLIGHNNDNVFIVDNLSNIDLS